MTSAVAFLAAIAAIIAWYLSQQRLMAKPWLEKGVIGDHTAPGADPAKVAKVGLGVFLAVVGSLFALLVSAYSMRMDMQDWRALPVPKLLWLNTALLIVSSMALQQARLAAHRGAMGDARVAMLAAGATCIAFLAGQLMAWQQLAALGYAAARNPANAFFYLITGLHGLHLLGGLVALALAGARLRRGGPPARLRLSIDLCAIYWHFLLLIWFVLFGLLLFT
jgi:cytochrome c oxidase subunit III